jgi:hypothetical protein
MAYHSDRFGFTLHVEGRFVGRGQWVVHAVLEYLAFAPIESRHELEAEGRLELLIGIARESSRGRAVGAHSIHVLVEGDREIAGFFRVFEEKYRALDLRTPTA